MKLLIVLPVACLFLPLSPYVAGCDVCAIYTGSGARGEGRTGLTAGFAEQFTHFGTLQVNGSEVSNVRRQLKLVADDN